jgi:glycosyltransferase involved in cell wall biosynthesis
MKILQVGSCSYSAGRGGISEHVRNISERLAKKFDITVFATNPRMNLPGYEDDNGVKVKRFPCYTSYFFSPKMIAHQKKEYFDVVHGHNYQALPMHFSFLTKKKKFIVTTHYHGYGSTTLSNALLPFFNQFGKMTLAKADKIIAVSNFEKKLLIKKLKIKREKIIVIPNGVDFNDFRNMKKRNAEYSNILYVGRLEEYKGVHYLVKLLPEIDEDVVLNIVGRGPMKRELMNLVKRMNLTHRVNFFENLTRKELLLKYFDASLFILLSRFESYSLAVADALMTGTPCIVANSSALTEWVDEQNCYGIELPIDHRKIVGKIREILSNRSGESDIRHFIGTKILDWDRVADRLEAVYSA